MKWTVTLALLALAVVGCQQPSPTPTPAGQRYVCGELDPEHCETVILKLIEIVPDLAGSPVAVADVLEEGSTLRRGGGIEVLVSFAAVGEESMQTWLVTWPMWPESMRVERWQGGPLPEHFLRLLELAGLDG